MANLQDNRRYINVSATKTITDAESGQVQNVIADAKVLTLPAAAAGKVITIRIGGVPAGGPIGSGANKSVGVSIVGTVCGLGTASGTLTGTKASLNAGDEIKLVGGAAIWYVDHAKGNGWAVA
jgi:hypothetical protein